MKLQLLLLATAFFAQTVGGAEANAPKAEVPKATEAHEKAEGKTNDGKSANAKPADSEHESSAADGTKTEAADSKKEAIHEGKCLASEEIIKDLETRENAVKQKEATLVEREKEVEAQKLALKEEMAKLEQMRADIQGIRGKELAEHEEKVNKLIETFESMAPKAAAAVISKIDEELAVTALSKLTTAKAGKILAALDPVKSSHLSEMMAFGNSKKGKEKDNDESRRSPASKK